MKHREGWGFFFFGMSEQTKVDSATKLRKVLGLLGDLISADDAASSVASPEPAANPTAKVASQHLRGSLFFKRSESGADKFKLFIPFAKVNELGDGSLIVEAWANVADFIDADGEFFSPEGLRKFVESWSPFGNFRAQHDPRKPAGTIRQPVLGKQLEAELGWWIEKHPETGTDGLFVRSHAVDPETVTFIKAGVYTGLSVGGSIPPGGRKAVQVEVDDNGVVLREIARAA